MQSHPTVYDIMILLNKLGLLVIAKPQGVATGEGCVASCNLANMSADACLECWGLILAWTCIADSDYCQ
jgi:hypothetical protein